MGKNVVALVTVFVVFLAMIYAWVSNVKNEPMHMPGTIDAVVPADTAAPATTETPAVAPAPEAPKQP